MSGSGGGGEGPKDFINFYLFHSESPFELILELFVFRILLPNIIEANDFTFRQLIKSVIKIVSFLGGVLSFSIN